MLKTLTVVALLAWAGLTANMCFAAKPYSPPFWQPGGHLQTILPYLFPQVAKQTYVRERWELPDGDFVDADWTQSPATVAPATPVLVLFHGLEGSSQSHYARIMMSAAKQRGWLGVVVHFRGCSGEPNRLPRVYYAGDADEINTYIQRIHTTLPDSPLYAMGVSLGGNALLTWLGRAPAASSALLKAAAAVSAPMALKEVAHRLDQGLNYWLYSKNFVATMQPKALHMAERFPGLLDARLIASATTVQDMDNAVTAVLYGAQDADAYYDLNAAKPWLSRIETATLILNAQNDPFVPFETLPNASEVAPAVSLEYPPSGGHAGFYGEGEGSHTPWLAQRLFDFFDAHPPIPSSSPDALDGWVDDLMRFHPATARY